MKFTSLIFSFVLLLFSINFSIAQNKAIKKVNVEELKANKHHIDATAEASVVFNVGKVSFKYVEDWTYILEVKKRIKVYHQDAYDLATVRIPYYVGSNRNSTESVTKIRATTYNLEGDKISTSKIHRSDVTEEEINDFYRYKVFTLPDVKEGSIIEYSYQVVSPYIDDIPQWFFQEDIPVDYAMFSVEIPEYLAYEEYATGFHEIKRETAEKENRFSFMYEEQGTLAPDLIEAGTTKMGFEVVPVRFLYYEVDDLPKIETNNFVHNVDNYLSSVKLVHVGVRNPDETRYEFGSLTWPDVVKTLLQSEQFGGVLKQDKFLRSEARQLTKGIYAPKDRALAILNYLQNRMTWDGYYGLYASKPLDKIYKENVGNVADINLIQTLMMRAVGLNAYPVVLSTRSHGIPVAPSVNGMNYVVTGVQLGNELVLFDASDPYSSPNLLDEKTLNWVGRLIQDNGESRQIDLVPKVMSASLINLYVDVDERGKATGSFRKHLTNYEAISNRRLVREISEYDYLDDLKQQYPGIYITGHGFDYLEENSEPLVEYFSFESSDTVIQEIEGKYLLNPLLFLAMQSHTLLEEQRSYPIDFSYPKTDRFIITIDLPSAFEVVQVPEELYAALPNGLGHYHYMVTGKGNQLQLHVKTEINTTFMNPSYYPYLKEFFDIMVSKETEDVVVKKNK